MKNVYFFLASLFAVVSSECAEPIKAGVATVDITPPVPYRMSGYFSERLSTGVNDPLMAKAVVFGQGDTKAALVFCDIVGITARISKEARARAEKATGIPAENIAIMATHSHTGPLYAGMLRDFFHKRTVEAHGEDIYEKVDYPEQLMSRLAEVIGQADEALKVVQLSAGYAQEDRLSFNRRFHMKDGSVRFNPGVNNPNIVKVAGPIDPKAGLLLLSGVDAPDAALVSFAMHLDTTGGTMYSGDYPFYLEKRLRKDLGKDFVSMFGAGTCGDLNHVDVTTKERRSADQIGGLLGETLAGALTDLPEIRNGSLAAAREVVRAPLKKFGEEEIAEARRNFPKVDKGNLPFLDRVQAYSIMDVLSREGTHLELEVQAFRISREVAIVTVPGEVFVELGLEIQKASPFETTILFELANDAPGYLPTKKAFGEGSYETVNSRIQAGGGEMVAQAAVRLLKDLNLFELSPSK